MGEKKTNVTNFKMLKHFKQNDIWHLSLPKQRRVRHLHWPESLKNKSVFQSLWKTLTTNIRQQAIR